AQRRRPARLARRRPRQAARPFRPPGWRPVAVGLEGPPGRRRPRHDRRRRIISLSPSQSLPPPTRTRGGSRRRTLEETQAEEEAKAEIAAPEPTKAPRRRAPRGPRKLPDNLPVERVVEPAPCVCGKCGGARLRKLGEVVSKTLECEPRRWKIIERVREKFACRDCESISEPPAPSHPIPRGFAGPSLLAMILVGKFCDHLPLNRQSAAFAREGVEIEVSTLADWRLHVDDTTVKVLAKMKTRTGRLWVYVRDDRPFGGQGPPAALYDYSP